MTRILRTSAIPVPPHHLDPDVLVVTPHQSAAKRLGVPHVSLRNIARRQLLEQRIGVATPLASRRYLKRAIAQTGIGTDVAAEADRVRELLGTILRLGIDYVELAKRGSERAVFLAKVAKNYQSQLQAANLIDPEALLITAAATITARKKLLVFGHFLGRLEEIQFIDKLADDGSEFYLPVSSDPIFTGNREWINRMTQFGWTEQSSGVVDDLSTVGITAASRFVDADRTAISSTAQRADDAIKAYSFSGTGQEARGILAEVKSLIVSGVQTENIAIIARDVAPIAEILSSVSREYGIPLLFGHRTPLAETGVGHFISLILDSFNFTSDEQPICEFDFESTVRTVFHKFCAKYGKDKFPIVRAKMPSEPADWEALGIPISWMPNSEKQSRNNWKNWLFMGLAELGVRESLGRDAAELTAYNALLETIEEHSSINPDDELSFDRFRSEVLELMGLTSTPFSVNRTGVQVLQPTAVMGGEFEHVFVMEMAEGVMPATVTDNPLIDFFERRKLSEFGIEFEDAVQVSRWEALYFYFVIQTARSSLTCTYSTTANDSEQLKSPFFGRSGMRPVPYSNLRISSVEELRRELLMHRGKDQGDYDLADLRRRSTIEFNRESSNVYDEYDGIIGTTIDPYSRYWSVSQLTRIGQCPFKWYGEKILGLAPPDEAADEIDPRLRGSFYHKVLELCFQKASAATDIRKEMLEHLEQAFEDAETSGEFNFGAFTTWAIQRPSHIEFLRKAISSGSFIDEGARIVAVEQKFTTEWMGLKITGRIDRIDESDAGLIAVDYKTSDYVSKIKDRNGQLKIDLQIPVYCQAALPSLYPNAKILPGRYLNLTKRESIKGKDAELDDFVNGVKDRLLRGQFPVQPDVEQKACTYCDQDPVCRRGERLAHKTETR